MPRSGTCPDLAWAVAAAFDMHHDTGGLLTAGCGVRRAMALLEEVPSDLATHGRLTPA
jgi:hypothetical protein